MHKKLAEVDCDGNITSSESDKFLFRINALYFVSKYTGSPLVYSSFDADNKRTLQDRIA